MNSPVSNLPIQSAPDGVILRAARPSDAESLNEMTNLPGTRSGTLGVPFRSLAETRSFLEGDSPDKLHLLALIGDRVVGSAGIDRFRRRRVHVASLGVGVHDDFTGRGIGTGLMAALIDAADNWLQIRRLELTVYVDNSAAIALYRKFGFEQEGVLRDYAFRNGSYVDALSMARLRLPAAT